MTFISRFLASDASQQRRQIRSLFLAITVSFGLAEVWACRYQLNPDAVDYLDIAREVAAGHWDAVANGYWGTLNSVLLAPLFLFHPSPEKELCLAHLEAMLVLLLGFFCFGYLLEVCLETVRFEDTAGTGSYALPEWALRILGYSLFLWSSLILVPVTVIGPDLLVTAFVYLAAGLLLRLRRDAGLLRSAAFGLTLGVGYWTKAIMFPIGLVFLAVAVFKVPRWKQNLYCVLAFVVAAAPLVMALSLPRGRFTFGDSGKLNYSALVSPGGPVINWQGDPPASGIPKHPTRMIPVHPPIYEFNGPIQGTYPPSYDPSYWNEGRGVTVTLRSQLTVIAHHVPPVIEVFVASQSSLTAGFLFLLFWSYGGFLRALAQRWELLAVSLATIGLYMLVHFETRFAGAFVVLIWLSLFLSLRMPPNKESRRVAGASILALTMAMLLTFASSTAKKIVKGCPDSIGDQLEMVHQLAVPQGDRIGVVGSGNESYWAHLAHLGIVAEIMGSDAPAFWRLPEEQRQQFYAAFRKAGAQEIIGEPPFNSVNLLDARWKQVGTTSYYRYSLNPL